MNQTVKKIWTWFTTVLVVVVVILAVLLVGARLVGFQVFSVLSGSMEPTYHVGALIYVRNVDPAELQSGDVITFMLDETTVATHRIVDVVPDETDPSVIRFRTKGDANEAEDGSLVHYKNVIGTPVFTIPKLGYLASYIQNPPGTYAAISAGAILLLLVFLPDLFDDGKGKDKDKKPGKRKSTDGDDTPGTENN
ncbi:MAG: signal peptidase I [Clostridia bacterium]|nr:signal peptidase I [Clostridia bacterium]